MKIEPFNSVNTLIKAVKVSSTYVEQGEVCVTGESLAQGLGLESGEFTPVISDKANCDVFALRGIYSRVNNVVTMSIYLNITVDTNGGFGTFNIDLPFASIFSNARDCYGTANLITNPILDLAAYTISADIVNNKCAVSVTAEASTTNVSEFVATIQYLVQ